MGRGRAVLKTFGARAAIFPAVLKISAQLSPKSLLSHFSFSSSKAWSRLNHKRGKKSVLVAWSNLDFVVRTTRNSDLAETVCQKRTKKAIALKCHDSLPDGFLYFLFCQLLKNFFFLSFMFSSYSWKPWFWIFTDQFVLLLKWQYNGITIKEIGLVDCIATTFIMHYKTLHWSSGRTLIMLCCIPFQFLLFLAQLHSDVTEVGSYWKVSCQGPTHD